MRLGLWLPLLVGFPGAALCSASVVDRVAVDVARTMAESLRWLTPSAAPPSPVYIESLAPAPAFASTPPERLTQSRTRVERAPLPKAVPRRGIRVGAERVLRLANAGARPSAIPVPARGERPAGLALVGVSGLGVGLVDGDVLTHAGGQQASSTANVVGLVIGARAVRASEVTGRFWRDGEPWNLVVEQPYVGQAPKVPQPPAPEGARTERE